MFSRRLDYFVCCRSVGRCSGLVTLHLLAQPGLATLQLPHLQHLILEEPVRSESLVLPPGALPATLTQLSVRLCGRAQTGKGRR